MAIIIIIQKPKIIIRLGIAAIYYLACRFRRFVCGTFLIVSADSFKRKQPSGIYGHFCTILCTAFNNNNNNHQGIIFFSPFFAIVIESPPKRIAAILSIFNFNFDCFVTKEVKKLVKKVRSGIEDDFSPNHNFLRM